jgi:UDP-glucose:(heptosyl)LPS alpha-1,3-glucosyltransferase
VNIALLIERMDPARGGREASTAQVASELARRGHAVTVLCQTGGWQSEDVRVTALGWRGGARRARLRNFLADAKSTCAAESFDIAHAMLPAEFADVYQPRGGSVPAQAETARLRRGPLGRWLHRMGNGLNAHRRLLARSEQRLAANPQVWIAPNSRMVAGEFEQYYGRRRNMRVIFNGVAVPPRGSQPVASWRQERRRAWAIADDAVVLLCPAANYRLKGVAEAITGLARWQRSCPDGPAMHMVFLGDRRDEPFRRLAGRLGLGERVHFAPPAEDIWPCYAGADGVVLLSWYDACSRVVLEAVGLSLPAITTARNGAAELLADGGGWVIDTPADDAGLLAALDEMADPAERARVAQVCSRRAESISIDRHVAQLEELYRDILASRGKEPAS